MATLCRRTTYALRGAAARRRWARGGRGQGRGAEKRHEQTTPRRDFFLLRCTYGILCRNCDCLDGEDISHHPRAGMTFSYASPRVAISEVVGRACDVANPRVHVSTDYESVLRCDETLPFGWVLDSRYPA